MPPELSRKTSNMLQMLFNALRPHVISAKVDVRGDVSTMWFNMPRDVKLTPSHFDKVIRKQRDAICWVEWSDEGLKLFVKIDNKKKEDLLPFDVYAKSRKQKITRSKMPKGASKESGLKFNCFGSFPSGSRKKKTHIIPYQHVSRKHECGRLLEHYVHVCTGTPCAQPRAWF